MFEYDVFLSFASKDEEQVRVIWQELCQNGLRVFWSDSNLKATVGQSWFDIIQNSVIHSQHFILLCTPYSMQSDWVKTEYITFFNQCYIPSKGIRRLVLKVEDNFDMNLLPPFLKNLQATTSTKEIINVLGGSELQNLRIELERTQQKLKSVEEDYVKITKDFDRIQKVLIDERFEKTKIKEENEKIKKELDRLQRIY